MKPLQILVADDHDVVRSGVRALLERQPGWTVCAEARTGREAVVKATQLRPDIVVLDISMPQLDGVEATRQIRRAVNARVLILTIHDSEQAVKDVVDAGAHGCVLKTDSGRLLVEAIRVLQSGGTFFSEQVRGTASRELGAPRSRRATNHLTPRQREVLHLLAEGRSNKEIGTALGISVKTAETHRADIMAALNLHSMSDLVRYAIRNGIIEP